MPLDDAGLPRGARILLLAAAKIERGHCKKTAFGGLFPTAPLEDVKMVCAIGALTVAQALVDGISLVEVCGSPDHMRERARLVGGEDARLKLIDFNDARTTTPAMVADRLRKLAAEHMEIAHAV